ncbi:MAG: tetratricopeptide repeat protein [Pseudomonadota bacterium]
MLLFVVTVPLITGVSMAAVIISNDYELDLNPAAVAQDNLGAEPELRRAFQALSQGKRAEAFKIVRDLLAVEPQHGLALEVLATWHMEDRQFKEAERLLLKSAQIEERSSVILKLGMTRIEQGEIKTGEQDIRKSLLIDPNNLLAMQTLARLERRRGNSKQAIQYYQAIINSSKRAPGIFTLVHIELAELYLTLEDPGSVMALIQSALDSEPPGAALNEAYRLASAAEVMRGNFQIALGYSQKLDNSMGQNSVSAVKTAIWIYESMQQPEKAEDRLQAAMKANPDPAIALVLGRFYLRQSLFSKAVSPLEIALAGTNSALQAELIAKDLAAAFYRTDQFEKTVSMMKSTEKRFPENPGLSIATAAILAANNRIEESLDVLNKLEKKYPQEAEIHYQKTQIMLQKGNSIEEAISSLERAIELNPKRAEFWVVLGELKVGEESSVLREIFHRGLSHNPDSPDLQYDLIVLDEVANGRQKTIKALDGLVTNHPRHYASILRLASLLATDPKALAKAESLLQQAEHLELKDFRLDSTKAWLNHHSGKSKLALESLTGLAKDYTHPLILFRMAVIYADNNRADLARNSARSALSLGLSGLERVQAIKLAE